MVMQEYFFLLLDHLFFYVYSYITLSWLSIIIRMSYLVSNNFCLTPNIIYDAENDNKYQLLNHHRLHNFPLCDFQF